MNLLDIAMWSFLRFVTLKFMAGQDQNHQDCLVQMDRPQQLVHLSL